MFHPGSQSVQQKQTRVTPSALSNAPPSRVTPSRRVPTVKPESLSPPEAVPVGKHNKTERRYRQKVQAAQADLRDSVPALRVLYGTSSEEQRRSTDFRAADGTVDGLGEITRPNASAKTTIFLGARLYIEVLQRRVASLQRKVGELENFRMAVAGEENLRKWQEDFNALEAAGQAELKIKVEDDSFDDEDDEEDDEDEPKRKKPRAVQKIRGGIRVFAAFAISFSLFPTVSTLFKDVSPDGAEISDASTTQVLKRIPLITAEHTSRLLAHSLPQGAVPHPHTIVDWGWRLIVALVLAMLVGPVAQKWTNSWSSEAKKPSNGSGSRVVEDSYKRVEPETESDTCLASAAGMIGGGESFNIWNELTSVVDRSLLSRWRVIFRLNRTAKDAYTLALLALLQPELPFFRTPENLWRSARARLPADASPALSAVLALPLEEAVRSLEFLPKTVSPIAGIAEQITLVHINDLYSRLFVRIVDASAKTGATSVRNLLDNLESRDLGKSLRTSAFDREIRSVIEGVPKGSAAHALGLVLIGLWGLFVGPSPSAQAALASALAAEEVKGAGSALPSVSAMLELLYPGSSTVTTLDRVPIVLPANALAIDRLAFVCIEYIRLLSSASILNAELSRLQRLEASLSVQKATSHLRLVLTQTTFVGLAEDEQGDEEGEEVEQVEQQRDGADEERTDHEARSFLQAKERLVGVLSVVGRRAAGRAASRDEDSGLEGDIDEL